MAIPNIAGLEGLAVDPGMMRRAAFGALLAHDPMAAAKLLAGAGMAPADFMQETMTAPGTPGTPLVELLDHRTQLESAKDIAADPMLSDLYHRITILRDNGVIPPKGATRGFDASQTPLGTPKYALTPEKGQPTPPYHEPGTGPARSGPPVTSVDASGKAIMDALFGTHAYPGAKGSVGTEPVNTPDGATGVDPFSPAAVAASEAGVSQSDHPLMLPPGVPPSATPPPLSPPEAAAPPVIPETPAQTPPESGGAPVAPDVTYLKKVLNGDDPGPYIPGMGKNDVGGYSPVETPPAAPNPSGNQGPELVGQEPTGAGPTNSTGGGNQFADLLAALQGVQAPESPKVTPPYTPPPPTVHVPQGSSVQALLDAIFGSGMGKRASGPSSLSAALRG